MNLIFYSTIKNKPFNDGTKMKEKLDIVIDLNQIKQTRSKRSILRFGDSIINKITKTTTDFGSKRLKKIIQNYTLYICLNIIIIKRIMMIQTTF